MKGLVGSLPAFLIHSLTDTRELMVCVMPDEDAAAFLCSDLEQLLGSTCADQVIRFPASGHKPYDPEQVVDSMPIIQRTDVLHQINTGLQGILVTSIEALAETLPPPDTLETETILLSIGSIIEPTAFIERVIDKGFTRVEFVQDPGEVALRGGILDVYPFAGNYPVRLEFFGDEIDSIRAFDPRSQRSISRRQTVRIVPDLQTTVSEGPRQNLLAYLPEQTLLILFNAALLYETAAANYAHAEEAYLHLLEHQKGLKDNVSRETLPPVLPEQRYLDNTRLQEVFDAHPRLLIGSFTTGATDTLTLDGVPQPPFNGSLKRIKEKLRKQDANGVRTLILCDSQGQANRLAELLEGMPEHLYGLHIASLHEGFEVSSLGLAVYTDHQIFNRYHRPTNRNRARRSGGLSLEALRSLTPGDFVVHIDHGIGKFAGMKKITVRGQQQEVVRVLYRGEDLLYVNVNALYKLHKYTGKEGHQPALTKLGSGQWERKKSRAKKRVKDIARDLIKLYAERRAVKGFPFAADTIWQRELEASFPYEDTPDQATSAKAVKTDMEEAIPMDRLVCGDVGFGKTEIAVRAAFKAVQDGKQVAVLVPTTILAAQHYKTFARRMEPYPVNVDVLSRFRSASEQKDVIASIKAGRTDVIIGTHRLVSKDVVFKDLGLLVIDEEQRFGVGVKEKIRKMRTNIDTLTLTATPIPRTLQFSLLGARDLSIINTPPPNRQPIVTEIHTFDKDLIRDAILYEVNRGGQIYFIHNRVQSIDEMAEMLRALVPNVRFQVGHGQMKPRNLERVMMGFIQQEYDVLISTNIVENGLDVPNANTIIINRAERFGLSDLHQLRGRVGRSDRKAFCYLLTPSIHTLTREGKQRLQAIEEFSDLGGGFNIAMRDLDIRGAGSMLGAEQSGFIEDIGYETYHKILDEAVQELRTEEFGTLFKDAPRPPAVESTVDVGADALLPETYVRDGLERLRLYRRISQAQQKSELTDLRNEIQDRFGPLPIDAENLLTAAILKFHADALRLKKVQFKNQRLFLSFPHIDDDPFFYHTYFNPLLEQLSTLNRRYVLKDTKGKLRVIIQNIPDLKTAQEVFYTLQVPKPQPTT